MEPLSNLHSPRDFDRIAMPSGPVLRQAQRAEIHSALQLILGSGGRAAGEEQVVDFLRFAVYRGIDLNDLWLADDAGIIVWAVLPVVSPGRTMLLFAPSHVPAPIKDTVVGPLVERVLEHFGSRAIELAQVLIDPGEKAVIRLFEQCRFDRLAELVYLEREVRKAHDAPLPVGISWDNYSPAAHDEFARTIVATYDASLDCPRLNGMRRIEDVIAGHKSAGEFDAKLWFLLRDASHAAIGVMLLNRSPRTEALEMVYLGLVPSARHRGLGDLMMQHALAATNGVGLRKLSLAVDSNNAPALRLYHRHGMSKVCSRVAMIRDLRGREKLEARNSKSETNLKSE